MDELQQKIYHMMQKNKILETENDRLENEIRDIRFKKLVKIYLSFDFVNICLER